MSSRSRIAQLLPRTRLPWFAESDRFADQSGFTLIELIVVVVIMPIVIGGIAVAMVTVFSNDNTVSTTISQSSDAQQLSSEFVSDVQSASMLTTNTAPTGPTMCATAAQLSLSGAPDVLSLLWADSGTEISYLELPDGSNAALYRNFCQGGSATPISTTVISRDATPGMTAVVAGSPCPSQLNQGPTCPVTTSWQPAAGTAYVKLDVTEPVTHSGSPYLYTLLASPRTSSPSSSGISGGGGFNLLLLGTSGSNYTCDGTLNDTGGTMVMDSTTGGSTTKGSVTASGGFYTANTTDPSGALNTGPGGSGTYNPSGTPASGPPIPDPYANLTPPSVPTTDGSLVGTTYQPGLYTSQISITGGADYTFASGIYYLEQGISLDGSGTIMGNNVFFYITGGSFGIGGAGRVTLGPLSSPPSPASGMVIWQTDSDATQVDLHGTASGSVIGGTIYAPNADVDIAGGGTGSGLQIGALLASQVSCNGGGGGKPVFTISGEQ